MRISVVVPCRNSAETIEDALRSVERQLLRPDELIVVDDGSTDGTAEIVRRCAPRARVISGAQRGVSAARNRGVRQANGDLIAFLDSDDKWQDTHLSVHVKAMSASSARWSFSDARRIHLSGAPEDAKSGFERMFPVFSNTGQDASKLFAMGARRSDVEEGGERIAIWSGNFLPAILLGNFVLPSTAIVCRQTFLELGGFDESLLVAEDFDLFRRMAAQADGVAVMARLVDYRLPSEDRRNLSSDVERLIRHAMIVVAKPIQSKRPLSRSESWNLQLGKQYLLRDLAYLKLSNGEVAEARRYAAAALSPISKVSISSAGVAFATCLPLPLLRWCARVLRRAMSSVS